MKILSSVIAVCVNIPRLLLALALAKLSWIRLAMNRCNVLSIMLQQYESRMIREYGKTAIIFQYVPKLTDMFLTLITLMVF